MFKESKFDYLAEAAVTVSHDWYGEKISREHFLDSMSMSIGHLKQLDRIKKSLFYGRDFIFNYDPETETIKNLPEKICTNPKEAEYIIHAIIGIATEAGELLEALHKTILFNVPFDIVNLIEESGDSFWYHALLAVMCQTDFETIERINIAKLRKRYPDKFTAFDANNRDLQAERTILEHKPENLSTFIKSKRGFNWVMFAEDVLKHVDNYTVPQYGDMGEDQVTDWTAEHCIEQAKKYMNRFGKNNRPGQEKLDLLKAAHYVSLACEKMNV